MSDHAPAILSRHAVRGLDVTRFATRFGGVVWIVSDPSAKGHRGLAQGDRREVIAFLRRA